MSVSTGVLRLIDVRARAALALAPELDGDPAVFVTWVDMPDPPALMVGWDDPWLDPGVQGQRVMGPCEWDARLAVVCVGSRVEPGPGIEMLEQLVTYTITRLKADAYPWPVATVQAPREMTFGGIPYLAARVGYRVPVTV